MELFPAIDLRGGSCVRLRQGDFNEVTLYDTDPLQAALRFAQAGASWLHVVDLDGAKDGAARQAEIVARLAACSGLRVQAGGGVRSAEDVQRLLQAGVARVVVGSLAAEAPDLVRGWLQSFGAEKIVLALDVLFRGGVPVVLTRGWQDSAGLSLWDVLARYAGSGLKTVLCTDVGRDGMLGGPNLALYDELSARHPELDLLASGGIGSIDDIRALAQRGLAGAITGKALYENRFDLAEAIRVGCGDGDAG